LNQGPIKPKDISIPGLSGENPAQKKRSDGSFEIVLNGAEADLEKKKKIMNISCWAELEKFFNILPLEFKFDFASQKLSENPLPKNKEQVKNNDNGGAQAEVKQATAKIQNTEALKEALINHIPLPSNIPVPSTSFMSLFVNMEPLSKSNLQAVINEIVKQAKLVKTGEKTELSLSLLQKELGEMYVTLSMKNGQVLIQINAGAETKKLFENHLEELKMALKEAKVQLDGIKITEVDYERSSRNPG